MGVIRAARIQGTLQGEEVERGESKRASQPRKEAYCSADAEDGVRATGEGRQQDFETGTGQFRTKSW